MTRVKMFSTKGAKQQQRIAFQRTYIGLTTATSTGQILPNHRRRTAMSNYELQIRQTGQIYDEAIRAAERESIEVLNSVVAGSRLHEIINNPIDSGIDEG
jgi:hypothetical protein